ncbi:MAG: DUF5041 domain-containing protein [Prolixibacteraceae bacterium]|nr:DUF5041 domain-containing protein [Prolixibacteraceae bacterium]
MKKITLTAILILILHLNGISQDFKVDDRAQFLKEDSKNDLQSSELSNIDLLQALELAGIKVHKFMIGTFDKEYHIHFILNEYINGEIVKTDTFFVDDNTYAFYENDIRYFNYIDQIKIFTKQEKEELKIKIVTYSMAWQSKIDYEITEQDQNYFVRYYSDATWQENVTIPLMVFASSWRDKKYGFQRFCGATRLDANDKETKTLLEFSPHYFKISYLVSKMKCISGN